MRRGGGDIDRAPQEALDWLCHFAEVTGSLLRRNTIRPAVFSPLVQFRAVQ
jgi:hypothetical protein